MNKITSSGVCVGVFKHHVQQMLRTRYRTYARCYRLICVAG